MAKTRQCKQDTRRTLELHDLLDEENSNGQIILLCATQWPYN